MVFEEMMRMILMRCEYADKCKKEFCRHKKSHEKHYSCEENTCINKVPMLKINEMNGYSSAKCLEIFNDQESNHD